VTSSLPAVGFSEKCPLFDNPVRLVQLVGSVAEDETGYPGSLDDSLMNWLISHADGEAFAACADAWLAAIEEAGRGDPHVSLGLGKVLEALGFTADAAPDPTPGPLGQHYNTFGALQATGQ